MTYDFNRIPNELKELKQWCLWRYEDVGTKKPTKVPYSKDHRKLSVTNPNDWLTFDYVVGVYNFGGYDGIGFVFSKNDPYAFIDLDATENKDEIDVQLKIFKEFDSYSEKSPSGKGLHIIVKGSIPLGRNRAHIEIYSNERYATMTGDVYSDKPISDHNDLINTLFSDMAKPPKIYNGKSINEPQTQSDEEIIKIATDAENGYKFTKIYNAEWEEFYPHIAAVKKGSSEACLGLVNMLGFYTQNRAQIKRIFLNSKIGNVKKYITRPDLIEEMIDKSFDQQPPKMDFDGFRIQLEEQLTLPLQAETLAVSSNGKTAPFEGVNLGSSPSAASNGPVAQSVELSAHNTSVASSNLAGTTTPSLSHVVDPLSQRKADANAAGGAIQPPPGLVGEIAQFIYQAAPRPVPEIALAGAMGLMAGICGRAYNISGTGLNQYILCLAMTGAGKEAMASGIDKIINAVQLSVPVAAEFVGPAEIASGQALIKYLANKSQSFVSILGEFGLRLRSMSSERANGAEIALRRMLLDLYNKSGHGQVARPSIYADSEKNTNLISSPAFSILGESTPERFYEILNVEMISEGLLPRFMLIEYSGERPKLNENAINAQPEAWLVEKIATLMAHAKTIMANKKVINIVSTNAADELLKEFDKFADKQINSTDKEIIRQLWNRAHIKVLKIAGLISVGVNYHNPLIEIEHVLWAKKIVENDIRALSSKFEAGEIGKNSSELKQLSEVKRILKEFVYMKPDKLKSYQISEVLYNNKFIPIAFIQRRLLNNGSFKDDKIGATNAIKRTLNNLIDSDFIAEVPKSKLIELGVRQKSYVVTNMYLLEE